MKHERRRLEGLCRCADGPALFIGVVGGHLWGKSVGLNQQRDVIDFYESERQSADLVVGNLLDRMDAKDEELLACVQENQFLSWSKPSGEWTLIGFHMEDELFDAMNECKGVEGYATAECVYRALGNETNVFGLYDGTYINRAVIESVVVEAIDWCYVRDNHFASLNCVLAQLELARPE